MATDRVCLIGAGSSGIATAKVLHERGIPFDCFEKSSGIGGNWRYGNDNGWSSAYRSLHINTSRDKMAYSDFPMPDHYPDFAHHSQILDYFEAYVDHFGFRDTITFRTEVKRVAPRGDGTYDVTVVGPDGAPRTRRYGAVLVANGHHWCPKYPSFPGSFAGKTMHSHHYRTPEVFADKNVLVVGVGNSGCDIACEASRVAARTFLSSRRGAHVIPKYLLGRPLDAWTTPLMSRLPLWFQRLTFSLLLTLARGPQSGYGFPTPPHKLLQEHPTISSELLNLIGHGRIMPKPNVEWLAGDRVRFVDGTEERIDVIVYATGYRVAFPFFEPGFMNPKGNRLPLYLHVAPPDHPNLYFIGLIQPLGAIMPLAELQSEWVADLLEGVSGLPDEAAMRRAVAREERAMNRRYVASERHTMQVDYYPYERALKRARRRGRRYPPAQALRATPSGTVAV